MHIKGHAKFIGMNTNLNWNLNTMNSIRFFYKFTFHKTLLNPINLYNGLISNTSIRIMIEIVRYDNIRY